MAAEQYYIERKDHKHQIYGFLGTTLVHGIILAALFLVVMYPPDPPLEFQGVQVSLGEPDMGGASNEPVPDPSQAENYVPISEQTEETPLTANDEESVAIKTKDTPKPKDIKDVKPDKPKDQIPQLELPKKVNQQALFTKRNNNNNAGGYGDGDQLGNQGQANGDPNGDKDGHGGGTSGLGSGDTGPDGISYVMPGGRKVKQLPNIEDHSKSVGKVVVSITVNSDGQVIKAVPGQVGSTTTEPDLLKKAKEGALNTRFNSRSDGSEDQTGTMTIIFRFKP